MLRQEQADQAAELILELWRQGEQIAALPEAVRPGSREEGYAIQARLEERSGQALFGWKIAATSEGGQRHIGVDGPLAGRLLAGRVLAPGETPTLAGNHMAVAEPEFAFRLGKALPPRAEPHAVEEVLDAVETLHLAIELPSSRFLDFAKVGAAQLIADNACAHQFLLGPAVEAAWRHLDLSRHPVVGKVAGKLTQEGSGGAVLGDPLPSCGSLPATLPTTGCRLRSRWRQAASTSGPSRH